MFRRSVSRYKGMQGYMLQAFTTSMTSVRDFEFCRLPGVSCQVAALSPVNTSRIMLQPVIQGLGLCGGSGGRQSTIQIPAHFEAWAVPRSRFTVFESGVWSAISLSWSESFVLVSDTGLVSDCSISGFRCSGSRFCRRPAVGPSMRTT